MFESFGMNGTAIMNEAVFAVYLWQNNGISMVCGHGLTQIAELVSLVITNYLTQLLRESRNGQQTLTSWGHRQRYPNRDHEL